MTYANPVRRLGALLTDAVVCVLLYLILKYGFGLGSSKLFVLYVLFGWLAFALPTISQYGGSLGTWLMGMGVTDLNGQRVHIVRASCRALFALLSTALCGMGYMLMFLTTRRQTLHDVFTNTLVVDASSLPPLQSRKHKKESVPSVNKESTPVASANEEESCVK